MSSLNTSGDLSKGHRLHNRLFSYQELVNGKWKDKGQLAVFDNTAFLNGEKLFHVYYHAPSNSLHYSYDKGADHRAGRLFFTEDGLAFSGTVQGSDGQLIPVRGAVHETVFDTQRKPKKDSDYTAWETFTLGTEWVDDNPGKHLKSIFKLGTKDISDRTAVTNVHQWETTIDMQPGLGPFGEKDKFTIVVDYQGLNFKGTYTDPDGNEYDWKGTAQAPSIEKVIAKPVAYSAMDQPPLPQVHAPMSFSAEIRTTAPKGPDLSVQDLMNVSSITEVVIDDKTKILDTAQTRTGEFFQSILIDSLDKKWIDDFFGAEKTLEPDVKEIMNKYSDFYKQKAVLNLGSMIKACFTDKTHEATVKKIDQKKLDEAWKAMGKDKIYGAQSQDLYIKGYKYGVPGIQPYLEDDAKGWAEKLYNVITSEEFLNIWAVQVASSAFKNIKQQMYEWYVQLSVLDPDSDKGSKMLQTTFAVILGTQFDKLRWDEDMAPYLKEVIDNMLNGDLTIFQDDMLKKNAEEMRKDLEKMISLYDNAQEFADLLVNLLTVWANKPENTARPVVDGNLDIYDGIAEMFERAGRTKAQEIWAGFKDTGPKILGSIFYAAAAGYLIYQIASGDQKVTVASVIQDIGLGLLATGFVVKSIEKLMSTRLGNWFRFGEEEGLSRITKFAKNMGKWFTEGGIELEGKLGETLTKILGKSSAEFFAKRLGPALAIVGIVISAYFLYKAIESGDIASIIFESINTFFMLADAVFIGLELMSFAWAGPVGFAVAIVGLLVMLVQFIYQIINPPTPPPDPVQQFVDGPLTQAGFVTA